MKGYSYDESTGEFRAEITLRESPLEPGTYLLPAFAALTPPPVVGAQQAAVWRNGAWALVPDHRGETYWAGRGQPVRITELEALPDPAWFTEEPPVSEREALLAQIVDMEAQQTPRRVREAALGIDGGWLADLEAQIATLRAQLNALPS